MFTLAFEYRVSSILMDANFGINKDFNTVVYYVNTPDGSGYDVIYLYDRGNYNEMIFDLILDIESSKRIVSRFTGCTKYIAYPKLLFKLKNGQITEIVPGCNLVIDIDCESKEYSIRLTKRIKNFAYSISSIILSINCYPYNDTIND